MESRSKIFGHPLHPMLIVFPLGLLAMSVVFDIIGFATGNGRWHESAYWMIGAGVVGGLLAAVPGAIDWLAIPSGTRAKGVGLWHALGNVALLALFAISWILRRDLAGTPDAAPVMPFVLSVIGIGLGTITGWLGGELVDRLGVGVDNGAHLNSISSLTGRPATEDAPQAQPGGRHVEVK